MTSPDSIFSRSILFWGEEKQAMLPRARVLVAGMGGLGCTVSELLVRAGVGTLILLDDGVVDEPDLNRQILYTLDDLGRKKVDAASARLSSIHGHTRIIPVDRKIKKDARLFEELRRHEFLGIADCLDDFKSRFILEGLLEDRIFLVHGGVRNDYGQITTIRKDATKSLKELCPDIDDPSPLPVCPGIVSCIGSLMAHEVLNNLWNTPRLINAMLIVELSDFSFSKIRLD